MTGADSKQAHRTVGGCWRQPALSKGLPAWARRGRGGGHAGADGGLRMAQLDHHTSREYDPQLQNHAFIFNLLSAPRGQLGERSSAVKL